tara:strand:- start:4362 stop:4481 length:120 start_codon:yes stop_codon:yes gene_type:complete
MDIPKFIFLYIFFTFLTKRYNAKEKRAINMILGINEIKD